MSPLPLYSSMSCGVVLLSVESDQHQTIILCGRVSKSLQGCLLVTLNTPEYDSTAHGT